MNTKQILLATLVVMMLFAVAPMASAGNGTVNNPYEILYIGWAWEYEGWGADESMGHVANAQFNVPINTQFNRTILDENGDPVTYYFNHTYIALDMMNTSTVPQPVINEIMNWTGHASLPARHKVADVVVVDMFFGNLTNQWNPNFVGVFNYFNTSNTRLVSVFAEEVEEINGTFVPVQSWAPANFVVKDLSIFTSPATIFSNAWFVGLYQSGATSTNADWSDYMTICGYIAPYI